MTIAPKPGGRVAGRKQAAPAPSPQPVSQRGAEVRPSDDSASKQRELKRLFDDARPNDWQAAKRKDVLAGLRHIPGAINQKKVHNPQGITFRSQLPPPMPSKTIHEITTELLAEKGVPEPNRPVLVQAVDRFIDIARTNPEAALAAVQQMIEAKAGAVPQTWQEWVAPQGQPAVAATEPPPKQKGGRKRKDLPPTEAQLEEAGRILWKAKFDKDAQIDPETLKKARRDTQWAYNEKKRREAWEGSQRRD